MNKKKITVMVVILFGLGLVAFGTSKFLMGDTSHVKHNIGESAIYSKVEIQSAMDAVEHDFRWSWGGCTLTELRYEENEESDDRYRGWVTQYHGEDAILIYASFDVDKSGGPGQTLEPNSSQTYWQWILVRDSDNGKWRHVDGGSIS